MGGKPHTDADLADWVLSGFSGAEEKAMDSAFINAGKAALCIIEYGVQEAANRYNGNAKG